MILTYWVTFCVLLASEDVLAKPTASPGIIRDLLHSTLGLLNRPYSRPTSAGTPTRYSSHPSSGGTSNRYLSLQELTEYQSIHMIMKSILVMMKTRFMDTKVLVVK